VHEDADELLMRADGLLKVRLDVFIRAQLNTKSLQAVAE
jgi:hypothetical protein